MLRAAILALTVSIVAFACALVDPMPPPGTTKSHALVHNTSPRPVDLTVRTPSGVLAGAVQPSSVLPGRTVDVALFLPLGQWWIFADENQLIGSGDARPMNPATMKLEITIEKDGYGWSCC